MKVIFDPARRTNKKNAPNLGGVFIQRFNSLLL